MGWHFNDLDVYVSAVSDVLGETSYETSNWVSVSNYGLVRSRPTVTRSTNSAQNVTIPGTLGEKYSRIEQRSNAKIQFEILIGDVWPHAHLKKSNNTFLRTVLNRALYLEQVLNMAKRVAVKEQGHDTMEYYEVADVNIELNDAYENAAVIKCTMDIYPFLYDFSSNAPITIAANASQTLHNELPYSECCPVYIFNNSGSNKTVSFAYYRGNTLLSNFTLEIKALPAGKTLVIDTKKMQAYDKTSLDNGNPEPLNKYVNGDYDQMRIPQNSIATITNGTSGAITVYMRKGLRI